MERGRGEGQAGNPIPTQTNKQTNQPHWSQNEELSHHTKFTNEKKKEISYHVWKKTVHKYPNTSHS